MRAAAKAPRTNSVRKRHEWARALEHEVSPTFFAAVEGKARYGSERRLRSAVALGVCGENFPYVYLISKTPGKMCQVLVEFFFAADRGHVMQIHHPVRS